MPYLAQVEQRPSPDPLTDEERRTLDKRFDANAYEVNVDGQHVEWGRIDEVEVAQAARETGLSGWIVKHLVFAGERYHVGIYFGGDEAVLTNVTQATAAFVVATIAYYARQPIRYAGVEGIAPLRED